LPLTSIDEVLYDSRQSANVVADWWDLVLKFSPQGGGAIYTSEFPSERQEKWKRALDTLQKMDDNNPEKRKYNHECIKRLASMFYIPYNVQPFSKPL